MRKADVAISEGIAAARRKLPHNLLAAAQQAGWSEDDAAEANAALANVRPRISSMVRTLLMQENLPKVRPTEGLDRLLEVLARAAGLPDLPRAPVNHVKVCLPLERH